MSKAAGARPKLHHVTMKTTRLREMIAWYEKVVGVEVNFVNPVAAWTSNDEANHRVAFLATPNLEDDPEKIKHAGMHHLAFEYGSFDELMAHYAGLRAEGIEPEFCLEHGLTTSIYYIDPDGNGVELQVDNFGDWEKSTHYMRTSDEFRENPIGVFFDPARLHAAYVARPSFAELRARIRAGEFTPDPVPGIRLPPAA